MRQWGTRLVPSWRELPVAKLLNRGSVLGRDRWVLARTTPISSDGAWLRPGLGRRRTGSVLKLAVKRHDGASDAQLNPSPCLPAIKAVCVA